jgi:hypothetical protein
MPVADTVAWEHSEPGTGPIPNYQNPESDRAIAGGWRRDSPPAAFPEYADPFMKPVFITMLAIPYESRG